VRLFQSKGAKSKQPLRARESAQARCAERPRLKRTQGDLRHFEVESPARTGASAKRNRHSAIDAYALHHPSVERWQVW